MSVAETRIAVGPSLPEPLAQLARDLDRRPGERVRLRPDDALELGRLEARLDLRGRSPSVRRESWSSPSARPSSVAGERGERVDEHERDLDRDLPQAAPARGRRDRAQEPVAGLLDAVGARAGNGSFGLAAGAFDVEREPVEPGARDAAAEPRRRGLLEPVGLVEDDGVVLGEHAAAGGDVGEVEGVVRDHELGLGGARPGGLGEA